MELAVNYSPPVAAMRRAETVALDRFKCPAWPDLIASVRAEYPVYVHFPLRVGSGMGRVIDSGAKRPADWAGIEALMTQTDTPLVNVHLAPERSDLPDIPPDSTDPAHVERIAEAMICDLRDAVARFGAERVIAENDFFTPRVGVRAAALPDVIRRVIDEAGCGLLLDLSHARLAAGGLGRDVREYIGALPVERIREIHVTGIQRLEGKWLDRMRRNGADSDLIDHYAGGLLDHLPMTDADWDFFAWAMAQIHSGAWGRPWVVTFECGGVGPVFDALTDTDALAREIPRLYAMVHQAR